jgi:sarcosine oxidase subunit gamma
MLDAAAFGLPATMLVQPLAHRSIVSINVFKGQATALRAALGAPLPAIACRICAGGVDYLWAGPGAWLAMADTPTLFVDISARARGLAAVTEQSDGRFLVRVGGPHAVEILAKLVPIDLHPSTFAPDATALTLAAHLSVQIWQEEGAFVLACFRSFGPALHHALVEAAAPFEGRG